MNVYGVYDMSAGGQDYVAANASYSASQSDTVSSEYMQVEARPPYVDLYVGFAKCPAWSASQYLSDLRACGNDLCTWETCGGQALHETRRTQSPSSASCGWGSDWCDFANFQDSSNYLPWFSRGGYATNLQDGGIFTEAMDRGTGGDNHATRPILYKP